MTRHFLTLCEMQRKYPQEPMKEVFEAAKSGDADLLSERLQHMDDSERTSALRTREICLRSFSTERASPLIVAAEKWKS